MGSEMCIRDRNRAEDVSTSGLQYALSHATLEPGSTLGLSNVVEAKEARVSLGSGTLLVMVQRTNEETH